MRAGRSAAAGEVCSAIDPKAVVEPVCVVIAPKASVETCSVTAPKAVAETCSAIDPKASAETCSVTAPKASGGSDFAIDRIAAVRIGFEGFRLFRCRLYS